MRLQNGQSMFSQPHCMVELFGAFMAFTTYMKVQIINFYEPLIHVRTKLTGGNNLLVFHFNSPELPRQVVQGAIQH
jgi:hypothetical protein